MRRIVILLEDEEHDVFACIADIPDGMDLNAEREEWNKWYKEIYCDNGEAYKKGYPTKYHSLLDQLLEHGIKVIEMETFVI